MKEKREHRRIEVDGYFFEVEIYQRKTNIEGEAVDIWVASCISMDACFGARTKERAMQKVKKIIKNYLDLGRKPRW